MRDVKSLDKLFDNAWNNAFDNYESNKDDIITSVEEKMQVKDNFSANYLFLDLINLHLSICNECVKEGLLIEHPINYHKLLPHCLKTSSSEISIITWTNGSIRYTHSINIIPKFYEYQTSEDDFEYIIKHFISIAENSGMLFAKKYIDTWKKYNDLAKNIGYSNTFKLNSLWDSFVNEIQHIKNS